MRRRLKAILMAGGLLALGLTQTATASAAGPFPGPLTIDTGSYTCTNGVCDLGSGNVGAFFAGAATSFGGSGPTPYTWSVVAGSLPTDMLLTPSYGVYSAYVYGIPITAVGRITFTLQVRDGVGDTARQAFSLTINPGTPPSDSVTITSATWSARFHRLSVVATDPIPYVAQTVSVTATGQQIGTLFVANGNPHTGSFFSQANPQNITVKSSLGASATSPVTPIR
jgi:hypothetical protein